MKRQTLVRFPVGPNRTLLMKTSNQSFLARRSAKEKDSVMPPRRVVDRWADGSLTQRQKGLFAVS